MPLCGNKNDAEGEEDPIKREKQDYEKFKQTVGMLRKMIESYHTELAKLNPLHEDFIRYLDRFTEGVEEGQRGRILKEADVTGGIKSAFDSSKTMYQDLIMIMDRLQVEMANLDSKLKERDIAAKKRGHYAKKVEYMKQRESMTGSPKMERNLKKFAEADAKFDDIDSFAVRELHRFMEHRFNFVEKVVQHHTDQLRKYYSDASANMGVFVDRSGPLKQVAPPSPSSPLSPTSPLAPIAKQSQSSSMIDPSSVSPSKIVENSPAPAQTASITVPVTLTVEVPTTPATPSVPVVAEATPAAKSTGKKSATKSKTSPALDISTPAKVEEKLPPVTSLVVANNESEQSPAPVEQLAAEVVPPVADN
jgi:hypothetical protein